MMLLLSVLSDHWNFLIICCTLLRLRGTVSPTHIWHVVADHMWLYDTHSYVLIHST